MRQMFAQLPHAERAPPYQHLLGTDGGEVWVGPYLGPEHNAPDARLPARQWLVLGPGGSLIARVQTPAGFRPQAIAGDELMGVFTDELGVESVRVHGILRSGP
jgi:hypothetical protein